MISRLLKVDDLFPLHTRLVSTKSTLRGSDYVRVRHVTEPELSYYCKIRITIEKNFLVLKLMSRYDEASWKVRMSQHSW